MGFQERSSERATVAFREDREGLQLANLCVPHRSTIIVSKPMHTEWLLLLLLSLSLSLFQNS